MLYDARIIRYHAVRFGGSECLWSAVPLDLATIPPGLYCYALESRSKAKELYQLVQGAAGERTNAATILSGSELFWARSFPVMLHPKENPEFTGPRVTLRQFAEQQGLRLGEPECALSLRPVDSKDLEVMFYSRDADEVEAACVGHLRSDFGSTGDHLYTTWWPHNDDQHNTPMFKEEFNALVNRLRDEGPLESRGAMHSFLNHVDGGALGGRGDEHGFIAESEHYRYFIRCNPSPGDYNCYIYCYDKQLLEQALRQEIQPPSPEMSMGLE